jgi:hypothetical protein
VTAAVNPEVGIDRGNRVARVLDAIRPEPFRGDVVAAGVVVLALFVALVDLRFGGTWGIGIRVVVAGLSAALVAGMAVSSPVEDETPRAYQSILYVTSLILALIALLDLAQLLGGAQRSGAPGTRAWVGALLSGLAWWYARRRNSAASTLLGAVVGVVVVVSSVDWIFSPDGPSTSRWMLLLCLLALVAFAVSLRDLHRRHAVALVDVAGLTALAIGLSFAPALTDPLGVESAPWGWELVLLVTGCALTAYAGVDRERGPAYIGTAVLALFVLIAARQSEGGASLIGWPIVLLLVAGVALAIGLRPSRPLPPEPGPSAPPAPTTPIDRPAAVDDPPTTPI